MGACAEDLLRAWSSDCSACRRIQKELGSKQRAFTAQETGSHQPEVLLCLKGGCRRFWWVKGGGMGLNQ